MGLQRQGGNLLGIRIRFLRARYLFTLAVLLPVLSSCGRGQIEGSVSVERKAVHLLDEPRHRTVYHEEDFYLLDVQLNPGDESLEHIHDQSILLTRLSSSSGPLKGEVSAITEYASSTFTHNIRNEGDYLLRILALVNSSSGSVQQDDLPTGLTVLPQLEDQWFRSYRLELELEESTPIIRHQNSGFITQVSPGMIHIEREDGITEELRRPGDWEWQRGEIAYRLTNVGIEPVSVVINEARKAQKN
jgi:hypothetical protein